MNDTKSPTQTVRLPRQLAERLNSIKSMDLRAEVVRKGFSAPVEMPAEASTACFESKPQLPAPPDWVAYSMELPRELVASLDAVDHEGRRAALAFFMTVWKDTPNADRVLRAASDVTECARKFLAVASLLETGQPRAPLAERRLRSAAATWGLRLLNLLGGGEEAESDSIGPSPVDFDPPDYVPDGWDVYQLWLPVRAAHRLEEFQRGLVADLGPRDAAWDSVWEGMFVPPTNTRALTTRGTQP
jgi:hypothetical protein